LQRKMLGRAATGPWTGTTRTLYTTRKRVFPMLHTGQGVKEGRLTLVAAVGGWGVGGGARVMGRVEELGRGWEGLGRANDE
jgi:hypothetical protein